MVGAPVFCPCSFFSSTSCVYPLGFYPSRLETVYSDSIRKAELEARLSYLKVSPVLLMAAPSLLSTHTLHARFLDIASLHLSRLWSSSTCCISGFSKRLAGCCRHSQVWAVQILPVR